ncbi:GNAT family N-acetyltransferase [Cumulibacter manganitolerans]|uniref:GNAT family N-acetyltransferase n=1 Tax=Cumulibacter manganitolerans TaxID=1884992 RepID=UPI001297AE21|nr:GNAT family N-acetyltransferase [Cumulibacter manganitolerans]
MTIDVRKNAELHRYEAVADGDTVAGFAEYKENGDTVTFTHTEVDDAFGGEGVGGQLAKVALDQSRSDGKRVVPLCPFIKGYIEKHPEYADLVR